MNTDFYVPPAKSQGMWRRPQNDAQLRQLCGLDRERLDHFAKFQAFIHAGIAYGIAIIRHGYLAYEYYAPDIRVNSLMHVYSCTKSMTSLAVGMLLEEKKDSGLSLESRACDYIPMAFPLRDARKKEITIRQLLSMSAGIPGEHSGALGVYALTPQQNEVDYILGHTIGVDGTDYGKLAYDPGTGWDYSCASYAHLSLLFQHIAGCTLADYLQKNLFDPIGIETFAWESFGGYGKGEVYCAGEEGFTISARDFARIGYLLLHQGTWNGRQLIPVDYLRMAVSPSQTFNPDYGFGFWNNRARTNPSLPPDAYAMNGHKANRLYVIPSLDLVIVRVGMGPNTFNDAEFTGQILDALTD